MKKPKTLKEFEALPVLERLHWLIGSCNDCADRCRQNMLLAGTWVEDSFLGVADRLEGIKNELEKEP